MFRNKVTASLSQQRIQASRTRMTIQNPLLFFANFLIFFGPIFIVFYSFIGRQARLVLLCLSSGFYWLLLILILSTIQYFADLNQIPWIIVSCIVQECARIGLYFGLELIRPQLSMMAEKDGQPTTRSNSSVKDVYHDFASGYGIGIISGLVQYIGPLVQSSGPGILVCASCKSIDIYFIASIVTCIFIGLNSLWSVTTYHAMKEKNYILLIWPTVSHLGASFSTVMIGSASIQGGCWFSITILLILFMIEVAICVKIIRKLRKDQ